MEEEEEEHYYMQAWLYVEEIIYQHAKYNYGRKQIANKPYGAN